jgi:hypothetical protein
MIDEIKKSINSIFSDRISSPFYGTLIVSWLIWNWKIVYLTFFIDQDQIAGNKIEFIQTHYSDIHVLVTFPILSTIVLLTVLPFITNGAFWLDTVFTTWRINQKNKIEGKQLLTIEQSIRLRTEIRELEESIEKLLEKKNEEIKMLKQELELKSKPSTTPSSSKNTTAKRTTRSGKGSSYGLGDYTQLKKNSKLFDVLEDVVKSIREKSQFPTGLDPKVKEYYLVNEIVDEDKDAFGNTIYFLTFRGEEIYKEHFNKSFSG